MSHYLRWRKSGGLYFFTLVTYRRQKILTTETARTFLRHAFEKTQCEYPFQSIATVLLPEHIHCIWQLPDDDSDFSTRWRLIKSRFTRSLLNTGFAGQSSTASQRKHDEHAVWQRRFWEHVVRDEKDLKRHVDYIHYNPVKHGLAESAVDWPYSTFSKFVKMGEYENDWGTREPETIKDWKLSHGD